MKSSRWSRWLRRDLKKYEYEILMEEVPDDKCWRKLMSVSLGSVVGLKMRKLQECAQDFLNHLDPAVRPKCLLSIKLAVLQGWMIHYFG